MPKRMRSTRVGDEIAEVTVAFVADRRLERDRVLYDPDHAPHLVERQAEARSDLVLGRLAARLLDHDADGAADAVQRLDHVDGHADRARLIRERAADRLADPPGRVRREAVPAPIVELDDGAHQADVAFLDEVEERQPALRVALRETHDEPEVGLDELALGFLGTALAVAHDRHRLGELGGGRAGAALARPQLARRRRDLGADPRDLRGRGAMAAEDALGLADAPGVGLALLGVEGAHEPDELQGRALVAIL